MNKSVSKFVYACITYALVLAFLLYHIAEVVLSLQTLWKVIFPLVLGGGIAFIVSLPMGAIEKLYVRFVKNPRLLGFKRAVSLLLSLVLFVVVIVVVLFSVIPEIGNTFNTIAQQIPTAIDQLNQYVSGLNIEWANLETYIKELQVDWNSLRNTGLTYAKGLGEKVFSSTVSIVQVVLSSLTTFVLGFIFSIYILISKEKLSAQLTRLLYAVLPEQVVEDMLYVASLTHRTFAGFFSSQCLEAVILGSIFFVLMTLFKMPYALLISMVISVTALVPIIGSFIGCVIGAFLILIVSPIQAFWFIVMFLVLQQIEGNLIYPFVVGSSVGLPSLWVLLAVLVGNGLMGVLGMLLFIPIFSVIYTLVRELVERRLKDRKIPKKKLRTEK